LLKFYCDIAVVNTLSLDFVVVDHVAASKSVVRNVNVKAMHAQRLMKVKAKKVQNATAVQKVKKVAGKKVQNVKKGQNAKAAQKVKKVAGKKVQNVKKGQNVKENNVQNVKKVAGKNMQKMKKVDRHITQTVKRMVNRLDVLGTRIVTMTMMVTGPLTPITVGIVKRAVVVTRVILSGLETIARAESCK
jgi:hypothetical protein